MTASVFMFFDPLAVSCLQSPGKHRPNQVFLPSLRFQVDGLVGALLLVRELRELSLSLKMTMSE